MGNGVNPLRGQNNVQGACDMGALPNLFTGYQSVTDPVIRNKFALEWGIEEKIWMIKLANSGGND